MNVYSRYEQASSANDYGEDRSCEGYSVFLVQACKNAPSLIDYFALVYYIFALFTRELVLQMYVL